jgi:hypothetical protein
LSGAGRLLHGSALSEVDGGRRESEVAE